MITDVLENTKAKYVAQLEEAVAKRDAEISAKCDELRAKLLAESNPEIESLEKVIADLDALIEKEKVAEVVAPVVEEVKEEIQPVQEEIIEEPVVEETPIEEPVVEEVVEPKVEVQEIEIEEKPSLFQKIAILKKSEPKEEVVEEEQPKSLKEQIVKIKKVSGRPGMTGIFTPKR